jgi:hypothetical protein
MIQHVTPLLCECYLWPKGHIALTVLQKSDGGYGDDNDDDYNGS